jgi:hypothetical protein
MADRAPMTETELLALCGSALTKIDTRGRRGTEMVTHDEIEAMAGLIDLTGAGHACLLAHRHIRKDSTT